MTLTFLFAYFQRYLAWQVSKNDICICFFKSVVHIRPFAYSHSWLREVLIISFAYYHRYARKKKILITSEEQFLRASEDIWEDGALDLIWILSSMCREKKSSETLRTCSSEALRNRSSELLRNGSSELLKNHYLKALDLICILSSMCKEKKSSETPRTHSSEALRTVPQSFWGTGPQNFSRTIT